MAEHLRNEDKIAIYYPNNQANGPNYALVGWSHGSPTFQFPAKSKASLPLDVEIPLLVAVHTQLRPIHVLGPKHTSRSRQSSVSSSVSFLPVSTRVADPATPASPGMQLQPPASADVELEAKSQLESFMAERKIKAEELATIEDGVKFSKANYFYLHFPSDDDEAQMDLNLLKPYLIIHGMTVLTNLDPDGWSKFCENSKMGVVIVCLSGFLEETTANSDNIVP